MALLCEGDAEFAPAVSIVSGVERAFNLDKARSESFVLYVHRRLRDHDSTWDDSMQWISSQAWYASCAMN